MMVLKYKLVLFNNIFLCALSILIYMSSPSTYSFSYNLLTFLFFYWLFYFNLNKSFKVGIGFELLFFISFMMGNKFYLDAYKISKLRKIPKVDFNQLNRSTKAFYYFGFIFCDFYKIIARM